MHVFGRNAFVYTIAGMLAVPLLLGWFYPWLFWTLLVTIPLGIVGWMDMNQTRHTILRNFPVLGHIRYLFEEYRPALHQYIVESDLGGRPLHRLERSVIYQRAKSEMDTSPFGTQRDVYETGYEWMNHSLAPVEIPHEVPRITIGGKHCSQPYQAQMLNISAMSYGSLSKAAVEALNRGARMGHFFHNTGEGGLSPYHLMGGDVCWQIGTGYFGCRNQDGTFSAEKFAAQATRPEVKLIEIKLSQGAKPGKGGILPAAKITPEIAEIRHVEMGADVVSPAAHTAFTTPIGLIEFVAELRELSGGKPVGFKLCVGKRREFIAICKAMLETGITPDFITVDGGEGGTGAAPLEFSDSVGTPLVEGLIFVHNALVGFELRDDIKIIASGKVTTGFEVAKRLALGADCVNAARAFMLSLGCIQALTCNSNLCPTGVTSSNPKLMGGLVVSDKAQRVYQYQKETVHSLQSLIAAGGLTHPDQLRPWHIHRRISNHEVSHYGELYRYLRKGDLLQDPPPEGWRRCVAAAQAGSFAHANPDPE